MIDRLAEIGGRPPEPPADYVLMEPGAEAQAFDQNMEVQAKIEKIRLAIDMLEPFRAKFNEAVTNEEQSRNQAFVDKTYKILKDDLVDLDRELKALKSSAEANPDLDPHDRQAINTNIACYYKEYEALLKRSQMVYNDLKQISKKILVRKVRILDDTIPPEKINEMVESDPETFQKLMKQKVMGKVSNEMLYAAEDIVEKCEGIKRLQNNVRELVNMLKDISQIVTLQGEKVNTIADHVNQANDFVAQGNKNLEQAKKHHSSYRCVG